MSSNDTRYLGAGTAGGRSEKFELLAALHRRIVASRAKHSFASDAPCVWRFRQNKRAHWAFLFWLPLVPNWFGTTKGGSTSPCYNAKQKGTALPFLFVLVGVRRFELPASWSRTKRSTKLSHTPLFHNTYIIAKKNGIVNSFFAIFWKTGKFSLITEMLIWSKWKDKWIHILFTAWCIRI